MTHPPPRRSDAAIPSVQLVTLWIGDRLGPVERACLRSALRHGHRVAVYAYSSLEGVPDGVELRDAAAILPEDAIIRHKNGSPALFSNRFRYELQRLGLGTWIDCDVYFVAPLREPGDYIMGDQGGGTIATGVLRLPAESPLLADLRKLFDERTVPPWLAWRPRIAAHLRRLATGRAELGKMPWGSAGPEALTWLARKYGLADMALPASRLYPVPWTAAGWLLDPARSLESVVRSDTIAVHLWNERLRGLDLAAAPPGSFAARLLAEGAA
ncbi:MAG: hypothetical protein ACREBO_09240 [Novosphingobium sp.]